MISQTSGKTKYLKNSIYRQQLVVKLELFDLCVLLIFFSQEGKINWCAADFFSCLSCGQKKVLLWTIPNSDVPALLGCKPNTFFTFPSATSARFGHQMLMMPSVCRVWRTRKLTEDDVFLKANLTQT